MLSTLDLIRRVPLFAMLTPEQAEPLAAVAVKRRFRRGELIVEQGKKSDALYIILSGRAHVVMTQDQEREVILATLQAGDYIGEMSLIDHEPHSASVLAEMQTDVLVLGRAQFAGYLPERSSMAYLMLRGLVLRLRHADRKISSLALTGVYGRVADVLLEHAALNANQEMVIPNKMARQDIAKMAGASREMVSRVMKEFEDRGFIEVRKGGSILVKERRVALPE